MMKVLFLISWIQLALSLSTHYRNSKSQNAIFDLRIVREDQNGLPVPKMIRNYGYICEVHEYTTEDGYINTLHRIPQGKNLEAQKAKGQAVFLQHGLLGTSADFVMGSPEKSLGYLLADLGYDVWMGNARGNAYSRKHVNLTLESDQYWMFSFDEMGKYDVPAALDYILKTQDKSHSKKLFYVGHSMGTVMFWVAMNENQQFMEEKIHHMWAMGPVAHVENAKSPIVNLAPFVKEIEVFFKIFGIKEFVPSNAAMKLFDQHACEQTTFDKKICANVLFLLTGFDKEQMNMTLLPIIIEHEPGGTSVRTLIHFAQEVDSKKFQKYDHGRRGNMKIYNQATPPEYDLNKVTLPVTLMWADNDWLADPKDVEQLFKLPNLTNNYRVPNKKFNHIDFLWGLDAKDVVYKQIFKEMAEFRRHD